VEVTESSTALAGYLAIHHHQNNLAMMFANPDKKVRLLLSYVLYKARHDLASLTQATYYRSIISRCHLEVQEIIRQYEQGELSDDMAERSVAVYEKKAILAHDKLMEIADASN